MSKERKSIFITGAASGMGRATARLFAERGWFVGIYDVNEQGLEVLASEIGAENCHTRKLDVTDRSAYQAALKEFDDQAGGRLDVLHNNAGIIMGGLFGDMDFADVEKIIQVNLMGVVNGIYSAYPLLKKTSNSLCFTTCSSSAILGTPGIAVYSMTKHAIKGLTEALSIELSLFDSRAADTLPGHVETGMMSDEFRDGLPKEGPWRLVPAEAVAEVVWASYHDTTGRLHWYVPEDMAEHQRAVAADIEGARNMSRDYFATVVEKHKNS
ncbi:MAG: SDR family oxidoreductase [Deltaproteobacteria bacterium]|jgi:NAD(P)-dependent dehydrogenase (short-subunit alcohol dehydrogenase family)|nr:SDR family oxidoreductase [Deltaproteobacteria bacterium]